MNEAIATKNTVLAAMAAFGSVIANQLGGWDATLQVLVALMAADYITGVLVAAVFKRSDKSESGTLSSKAGFTGLCKKGVALLLVWIGVMLDRALETDYVHNAVVLFFCGNEGLSLLENIGLMGVPFPQFLHRMLEALQSQGSEGAGS